MVTPPLPWEAGAWQLFWQRTFFLISNLNLFWNNLRLFLLVLSHVTWDETDPHRVTPSSQVVTERDQVPYWCLPFSRLNTPSFLSHFLSDLCSRAFTSSTALLQKCCSKRTEEQPNCHSTDRILFDHSDQNLNQQLLSRSQSPPSGDSHPKLACLNTHTHIFGLLFSCAFAKWPRIFTIVMSENFVLAITHQALPSLQ